MNKLISLVIPNEHNNYHPYLIRSATLSLYLVALILINVVFSGSIVSPVSAAVDASALYQLHNEERQRFGLKPLSVNTSLIVSATNKANAMLQADCWSHFCPEGKSPWDFFDSAGYTYVFAGENLAEGFRENGAVMNAWMNSPTHRENVLKGEFTEIGIGFAYGNYQGVRNNTIVVVHFGSRSFSGSNLPGSDGNTLQGSNKITIDNPENGYVTNDNSFPISGKTIPNSEVAIERNNELQGRVEAQGESFTFRPSEPYPDGASIFKALAYQNNTLQAFSNEVQVTVDTVAPEIIKESVRVASLSYNEDDAVIINLKTDSDASVIESNIPGLTFRGSLNNWEGEASKSLLGQVSNIKLTAIDLAGNSSSIELPTGQLMAQVLSIETTSPKPTTFSEGVLESLAANITSQDAKVQINMMFIVFLMSLFGIDFYVLHKTGMSGVPKRNSSHLHFSILAVLLIVVLIGSISGNILTGLGS